MEYTPQHTVGIAVNDEPMNWIDLYEVVSALSGRASEAAKTGAETVVPGLYVTNAVLPTGLITTAERRQETVISNSRTSS